MTDRLVSEQDLSCCDDDPASKVPRDRFAIVIQPGGEKTEFAPKGFVQRILLTEPDLKRARNALKLLLKRTSVEESLGTKVAKLDISIGEFGKIGCVAFVSAGALVEKVRQCREP